MRGQGAPRYVEGITDLVEQGDVGGTDVARPDGEDLYARAVAVVLVACGVAASWTAFALARTAKPDPVGGWEIPALHSAASDRMLWMVFFVYALSGFGPKRLTRSCSSKSQRSALPCEVQYRGTSSPVCPDTAMTWLLVT